MKKNFTIHAVRLFINWQVKYGHWNGLIKDKYGTVSDAKIEDFDNEVYLFLISRKTGNLHPRKVIVNNDTFMVENRDGSLDDNSAEWKKCLQDKEWLRVANRHTIYEVGI